MGLVLHKFDTYDYTYGNEVIRFKRDVPVHSLPHKVEDFLFHLGYFHPVYDKFDLPFLDMEANCYMALNYKGETKMAEVQDWAAIVKCNYIQTDFGAPMCTYEGGDRKVCKACLNEDRICPYGDDSAAHILQGKDWIVMGGKQLGDFIGEER